MEAGPRRARGWRIALVADIRRVTTEETADALIGGRAAVRSTVGKRLRPVSEWSRAVDDPEASLERGIVRAGQDLGARNLEAHSGEHGVQMRGPGRDGHGRKLRDSGVIRSGDRR